MIEKIYSFPDIKTGWYVTYFFNKKSMGNYDVTLYNNGGDKTYISWDGTGRTYTSGTFQYIGSEDEQLIFSIMSDDSNYLDNTWSDSLITPNSGKPTLGRAYTLSFEDYSGGNHKIYYNSFTLFLIAGIRPTV